jgi:histidyl-tRNA synthetase
LYGFAEVMTPVFEYSEVFHRTLGDTSDIVSKETYTFDDRGGDSITLRPEITAAIVRAFLSGGWQNQDRWRYFYAGPAFRYERPQKGRLRQFHQLGVEWLGEESVLADVQVIALARQILQQLGLEEVTQLELNSLGDRESRAAYRATLVDYLSAHRAKLSEDSLTRLEKNPLRILDSKDEGDREVVASAPQLADSFNPESKARYEELNQRLSDLGIAYTLNPKLVRGLDYYQHCVFEFTTDRLGSQNAVIAGGRYDGLVKQMGGKQDLSGIGFAGGIERIIALREEAGVSMPQVAACVALLPMGEAAEGAMLPLMQQLRAAGIAAELIAGGNMGKRMKKADKFGASHAVILGDDELAAGQLQLRNLADGSQQAVAMDALVTALKG